MGWCGDALVHSPVELADDAEAGFDTCSTASNHTLDHGAEGVTRTLDNLDRVGLRHTGSARSARETVKVAQCGRPARRGSPTSSTPRPSWPGPRGGRRDRDRIPAMGYFTETAPRTWRVSAVEVRPVFMDYHPQARLVDLATAKAAAGPRATAYDRIHRRIAESVNARGAASDACRSPTDR